MGVFSTSPSLDVFHIIPSPMERVRERVIHLKIKILLKLNNTLSRLRHPLHVEMKKGEGSETCLFGRL